MKRVCKYLEAHIDTHWRHLTFSVIDLSYCKLSRTSGSSTTSSILLSLLPPSVTSRIHTLDLSGATPQPHELLVTLLESHALSHIRILRLSHWEVTEDLFTLILQSCPTLEVMDLDYTKGVTSRVLGLLLPPLLTNTCLEYISLRMVLPLMNMLTSTFKEEEWSRTGGMNFWIGMRDGIIGKNTTLKCINLSCDSLAASHTLSSPVVIASLLQYFPNVHLIGLGGYTVPTPIQGLVSLSNINDVCYLEGCPLTTIVLGDINLAIQSGDVTILKQLLHRLQEEDGLLGKYIRSIILPPFIRRFSPLHLAAKKVR